jgi:hypothetical protein
MKVTLAKYGGWTATMQVPPLTVDAANLPKADAKELARLVTAAKVAPQVEDHTEGRARDAMSYELTLEEGGKPVVLSQSDTTMTKPFAELLAWLEQHSAGK